MTRKRALVRVGLTVSMLALVCGCANRRGDLGAVRDEQPIRTAAQDGPPAGETVALEQDAAAAGGMVVGESRDEPRAELVSLDPTPLAEVAPVAADKDKPAAAGETLADATPPPVPPKPAEETPEQKAERLLKEASRLQGVEAQARTQEADAAYQVGMKLFNDLSYEQALNYFEKAVKLDPAHAEARQKLQTVRALLGMHVSRIRDQLQQLEREERVQMQETLMTLVREIEEARKLEDRGSAATVEVDPTEKEKVLADQLERLRRAQDRYRRVK
jgi:tetratricopeptide (TPR) repeat protein